LTVPDPDLFALYDSGARAALLSAGWVEGSGPTAGRWRDPASKLWLPAHEAAARVRVVREDDGEVD
jgi:hypothetical protein